MKLDVRAYDPQIHGELDAYDYTTLAAVNTCPTYAILRYRLHKVWNKRERNLALEAGTACHNVFASARLWSLFNDTRPNARDHAERRGRQLFGDIKWEQQRQLLIVSDDRQDYLRFCLKALELSGYYDDPSDRRRTLSNLEQSCIAYLDRLDTSHPVYLQDAADPTTIVGIELPFDLYVDVDGVGFRFVGRFDGLHTHRDTGEVWVAENKTASRLDLSWVESFRMSHQITGYMLAASHLAQTIVRNGFLLGVAIPLPRSYDFGGVIQEVVTRNDDQFAQWAEWARHTVSLVVACNNDPVHAPKYSHSCNRYFRACPFIPYCAGDARSKAEVMEFLEEDRWSPLDDHKGGD